MAINVVIKSVWDDKGVKNALGEFQDFGKKVGIAFAAVGAATVAATAALVKFGADSIAAAENVAQANNRLEQVAKSMNLFGTQTQAVTKRLIDFAEANELTVAVDAEVIKATQAKLLTFKNLAQTADQVGGSMDRATMAALDLAATGFGSAETNAVQLGKALQDPIKGITALARAGVTFTAQEKENIKVLVESGKTLEAQNLILTAIETQVGGTAAATAKASDRMKLAFDNISESVGAGLLPVFNEFVDEIVKVTPELEEALAPAAEEIAQIFRERVLPAIQNFTKWLASPQGTQTLKNLTNAVIDAIENFINFTRFVFDNWKTISTLTVGLGSLYAAIMLVRTGVQLWTAAQIVLNSALGPLYILATILAGIAAGLLLISNNAKKATNPLEAAQMAVSGYEQELINLENAYKSGAIDQASYERQTAAVRKALENARKEVERLNNTSLSKFRGQLGDTRVNGQKLANQMRELYYAMQGIKPPKLGDAFTDGDDAGGEVEKAFDKVQKFIKDAQKDLAKAQDTYNDTIAKAQKKYAETVLKTERDFGQKLAEIVQQSQDRLRTAFANVVRVSLSDIFEVNETKSVANLVAGLTNRLRSSQALLERAGKLNAAGFSQTFIEQVVAAGTETGNELAQAILDATPQTQRELQSLFSAIESTAETGMDSLARQIYESAGLATTELRNLYAQTQTELTEALLKLKEDFDQEVLDANNVLIDAVKEIRAAFKENIDSMKGDLGGLGNVVRDFYEKLNKVQADAAKAITPTVPGATGATGTTGGGMQGVNVLASSVTNATGILIDSINDLEDVRRYFEERIVAASEFAAQSINRGNLAAAASAQATRDELFAQLRAFRAQGTAAVGTVINVNVKTDSTQSLAMVGKTLGNTITKYVQSGGQVVVSPVG